MKEEETETEKARENSDQNKEGERVRGANNKKHNYGSEASATDFAGSTGTIVTSEAVSTLKRVSIIFLGFLAFGFHFTHKFNF